FGCESTIDEDIAAAVDGHLEAEQHAQLQAILEERELSSSLLEGLLRVQGDAAPREAAGLRGGDEGRCGLAVGVEMEIALQISLLDEERQLAGLGGLDLALVLAQLDGDERQTERRVHLFFGASSDEAAGHLAVLAAALAAQHALEDAVLAHG